MEARDMRIIVAEKEQKKHHWLLRIFRDRLGPPSVKLSDFQYQ